MKALAFANFLNIFAIKTHLVQMLFKWGVFAPGEVNALSAVINRLYLIDNPLPFSNLLYQLSGIFIQIQMLKAISL